MTLPRAGIWGYSLDGITFTGEYRSARAALDAGFEIAPGIPERIFAGRYGNPCRPSSEQLSAVVARAIEQHIATEFSSSIASEFVRVVTVADATKLGIAIAPHIDRWLRDLSVLICPIVDVIEESYEFEFIIDEDATGD